MYIGQERSRDVLQDGPHLFSMKNIFNIIGIKTITNDAEFNQALYSWYIGVLGDPHLGSCHSGRLRQEDKRFKLN